MTRSAQHATTLPTVDTSATAPGGRGARFWFGLFIFQLVFGFSVFVLTRAHYLRLPPAAPPSTAASASASPAAARETAQRAPAAIANAGRALDATLGAGSATAATSGAADGPPASDLATGVLRQRAGAAFEAGNFAAAARDYAVIVEREPDNVEMLNNLGISLHYSGRSDAALLRLRQGLALQPRHQRSLLTLGFVSHASGDLAAARQALQQAVEVDPTSAIGVEAARQLQQLQ